MHCQRTLVAVVLTILF
jgi:hypothetical protein